MKKGYNSMKQFKVGFIGMGRRGTAIACKVLTKLPYVEITAICDLSRDRMDEAAAVICEKTGKEVTLKTTDYREVIESNLVDTVLVFSGWMNHFEAATLAMKSGKPVGIEVGGTYNIEQCYDLVKVYEETGTPLMLLENCCYGEIEMTVANMARQGLFGTIVHCDGAYKQDARKGFAKEGALTFDRGLEHLLRNCDHYPTHGLGPVSKILNINRGNRFVSLVSMSSKAAGAKEYLEKIDHPLKHLQFSQGDIFTTMIKCAGGETITLTLDSSLPRYYSRDFTVQGTKGMYEERTNSVFLDEEDAHWKDAYGWKNQWGNMKEYMEEYRHPMWKKYREDGVIAGVDGMDYLMLCDFFHALDQGLPMPIDVYDAVTLRAVTALSEQSVLMGSTAVPFPDFTNGKWMYRK